MELADLAPDHHPLHRWGPNRQQPWQASPPPAWRPHQHPHGRLPPAQAHHDRARPSQARRRCPASRGAACPPRRRQRGRHQTHNRARPRQARHVAATQGANGRGAGQTLCQNPSAAPQHRHGAHAGHQKAGQAQPARPTSRNFPATRVVHGVAGYQAARRPQDTPLAPSAPQTRPDTAPGRHWAAQTRRRRRRFEASRRCATRFRATATTRSRAPRPPRAGALGSYDHTHRAGAQRRGSTAPQRAQRAMVPEGTLAGRR